MGIWGLHVLGVYGGVCGWVTQVVCEMEQREVSWRCHRKQASRSEKPDREEGRLFLTPSLAEILAQVPSSLSSQASEKPLSGLACTVYLLYILYIV